MPHHPPLLNRAFVFSSHGSSAICRQYTITPQRRTTGEIKPRLCHTSAHTTFISPTPQHPSRPLIPHYTHHSKRMDDPSMPWGSRKKFTRDGTSRVYHGHSVICHLPEDSPLRATLHTIREALASHPLAHDLLPGECLLPSRSWHMTVFICVRDRERAPQFMPYDGDHAEAAVARIGLEGDYNDWLEYSITQVEALRPNLSAESRPPYVLDVPREIPPIKYNIGLRLHPTTEALWTLREELWRATGIKHPNYDSYAFHITLAYTVRDPSPDEAAVLKGVVDGLLADAPLTVEFPKVALCSFENMQDFSVEVVLADAGEEDDDEGDEDEDENDSEDDDTAAVSGHTAHYEDGDDIDEDDDEEEEDDDDDDNQAHLAMRPRQ